MPLAERPHFATLKALRSGRVHILTKACTRGPCPRSIEALEELAALLHPAAIKNKEKR
jgi:ABC-type Fe3+-hydroxamate transport system substrate-binding protein